MRVLAKCWTCGKVHDVSKVKAGPENDGMKCECGGFVISPSGKLWIMVVEHETA